MQILLRRRVPSPADAQSAVHKQEYRLQMLQVERLSLGSGADQHVQINERALARRHAVLERTSKGILRLRALGAGSVTVNGTRRRQIAVQAGDVLTLGAARLSFEKTPQEGPIVIRVHDPQALDAGNNAVASELSIRGSGVRISYWSRLLVWTVLGAGLLVPLAGALNESLRATVRSSPVVPSDSLWLPGPLHASHQAIGANCNACHIEPFQRVPDRACATCHQDVQQHVNAHSTDTALFADRHCADCHQEHDAQHALIDTERDSCVGCHGKLTALKPTTHLQPVADFSRTHPEFTLSALQFVGPTVAGANAGDAASGHRAAAAWKTIAVPPAARATFEDTSNLIFSHKTHLDPNGIKGPGGGSENLACANCHQSDAAGRYMLPIRMETHCARCHSLQFDEHDPKSTVPHGDVPQLLTALREHFSRTFLDQQGTVNGGGARRPGDASRVLTEAQQRRALDWANRQTLLAASELLEKRVCVECHKISVAAPSGVAAPAGVIASTTGATATGVASRWQVAPVRLNPRWFPGAKFSHEAHKTAECTSCHAQAPGSTRSADVLLPGIRDCRGCHTDSGGPDKVATTCLTCHQFHVAGKGAWLASEGNPSR